VFDSEQLRIPRSDRDLTGYAIDKLLIGFRLQRDSAVIYLTSSLVTTTINKLSMKIYEDTVRVYTEFSKRIGLRSGTTVINSAFSFC
jgi:hypothetical protein